MLAFTNSHPPYTEWLESACFSSVTQMLLHQLCNSLYMTFTLYHSLIARLNALAEIGILCKTRVGGETLFPL